MSTPPPQPPMPPPSQGSGWTTGQKVLLIAAVGCLPMIGILGILTAIAVPNYLKFNCKAKTSEAKTNLSGMFTAEKAFFGEYNEYTTDLVALNWYPDGTPTYVYGFSQENHSASLAEYIPGFDPTRKDTLHPDVQSTGYFSDANMVDTDGNPLGDQFVLMCADASGCTVDSMQGSFTIAAYGDVDSDISADPVEWDGWTINEKRELTSVYDDCGN